MTDFNVVDTTVQTSSLMKSALEPVWNSSKLYDTSINPSLSEDSKSADSGSILTWDKTHKYWTIATVGNVVGPDTIINNTIPRFDSTTGKIIQGSGVTIDDSNNCLGMNNLTVGGLTVNANGQDRFSVNQNGATTIVADGAQVNENYVYTGTSAGTLTHRVYSSRGTPDAPIVSLAGDRMIGYACFPRLSNGFATGPGARMSFIYRGDASSNTRACDIEFETSIGVAGSWPRLGIVNTGGIWIQVDGFDNNVNNRVYLHSEGSNVFSQYNNLNAQTFRLYNTRTDASNYERLGVTWSNNVCYTKAESQGTGTARIYMPVTGATTVANLPSPSAAGAGARAFVTDSIGNNFLDVLQGGGSNSVPVVSDGTNWLIG